MFVYFCIGVCSCCAWGCMEVVGRVGGERGGGWWQAMWEHVSLSVQITWEPLTLSAHYWGPPPSNRNRCPCVQRSHVARECMDPTHTPYENRHGCFLTHVLAEKLFTINHVRLKLVALIVLRCDPIPIRWDLNAMRLLTCVEYVLFYWFALCM